MATDVDIANRALSRIGARRLTTLADATEAARAINSAFVQVRDEVLRAHPWKSACRRAVGTWVQKVISAPGISQANPGVVTSTGHGLAQGTVIRIDGVAGMTQVNGNRYRVGAPVFANDFRLNTLDFLPVNTASFGAWVSGGTVTVVPLYGYANQYAIASTVLRVLELEDETPGEHWEVEGRFLLSDRASPINYRYILQLTTYTEYDPLLVSAFAARLAVEVAEELTQSADKRKLALAEYEGILNVAKAQNAREQTPSDPIESEWLTARSGVY
jgi:hypothetical protein